MFSSLYAQKKIALADCVHAFLLLARNKTYFTFITRPHCGRSIGTACVPSSDITNTMQRGWWGVGGGGGGWSLACHRRGLSVIPSQSMWNLWWTKWHWHGFLSFYFCCPLLVSFHQWS
jgi:hypothetical protein